MRHVCVLGATGSVGRNTLDVIARNPGACVVESLSGHSDVAGMRTLIRAHRPRQVVMVDPAAAQALRDDGLGADCEIRDGSAALVEIAAAAEVDTIMAAIVGAAGLPAIFAAAAQGKRVLLATKEALVSAGPVLMNTVRDNGAEILPVDSEHNAIFQCLPQPYRCGSRPNGVRRLILTASGGPFRDWTLQRMHDATPAQAIAHPNWDMGRKISVDSASMMNKGLELIEAAYLFALAAADVDVVVHRQSIVHSLVEFTDGSTLAQLGTADMRIPIANALLHPRRGASGAPALDLVGVGQLDFEAPDAARFPALRLAREALQVGGGMPAVFNAANEVAVAAFLEGHIRFTDIPQMVESVMGMAVAWAHTPTSLDDALAVDARAREQARAWRPTHG